MIFDVPTLISFLSGNYLAARTLASQGPLLVLAGEKPKRFLVPGDEVTIEVEGLSILTNPVVEEVIEEGDLQS